jgi:hypothetical protein
MAKRERILPLLECRKGGLTNFPNADHDRLSDRRREAPPSAFVVNTLKASIGFSTKPYVSSVGHMASHEEHKSVSCRDISSGVRFVPIRDDPEMVVNLGLRVAEAGLQRLGVAA